MRRNAFFVYLNIQVVIIALVMVIFKFIVDRQVAATVAGSLFVVLPVVLMGFEYKRAQLKHFYWFLSVMQFWTLFALPIMGIRLLNWGVPFDQLSFLGIAGPFLHHWSSKSYMVMMAVTAWVAWKGRSQAG